MIAFVSHILGEGQGPSAAELVITITSLFPAQSACATSRVCKYQGACHRVGLSTLEVGKVHLEAYPAGSSPTHFSLHVQTKSLKKREFWKTEKP